MSLPDDVRFMKQALAEASLAALKDEIPVGALIVCRGHIIARAHNQTEQLNDPTAHAEMLAITSATQTLGSKYLAGCTLYVTLEPCAMCAGAIAWAQISVLVYGAPDPKRGFRLYAPQVLHPKTIIKNGILEQECADRMTDFFRSRR
jgi:tRNA(adenine34) deaminase